MKILRPLDEITTDAIIDQIGKASDLGYWLGIILGFGLSAILTETKKNNDFFNTNEGIGIGLCLVGLFLIYILIHLITKRRFIPELKKRCSALNIPTDQD